MAHPVGFAMENAQGMAGELVDERLGEVVIAHGGERRLVDDVISRPAAQALKKRLARLALPGAKDGEIVRADLGRHPGLAAMAGAGVVDRDIGRAFEAGVQHCGVLGLEGLEPGGQKAHHLALRDHQPHALEQRQDLLAGHMALKIKQQDQAVQIEAIAPDNAGIERRDQRFPSGVCQRSRR